MPVEFWGQYFRAAAQAAPQIARARAIPVDPSHQPAAAGDLAGTSEVRIPCEKRDPSLDGLGTRIEPGSVADAVASLFSSLGLADVSMTPSPGPTC
jgi:hypothetical protein